MPVKRKSLNCPVDVPALADIKLDGKLVKLEQLLQLQPWRKPVSNSASDSSSSADGSAAAAAAADAGSGAAGAAAAAAGAGEAGSKAKRPKSYKVVEFTVKAAAVLAGHEAPVLPAQLLQWALQVSGPACVAVGGFVKLYLLALTCSCMPALAGDCHKPSKQSILGDTASARCLRVSCTHVVEDEGF